MVNEKMYKKIEQLKILLEFPRLYLSNFFADLRTQIDLAFFAKELELNESEALIELRKNWHEMIYKLNSLEEKCLLRRSMIRSAAATNIFRLVEIRLEKATQTLSQDELSKMIQELDDLVYDELTRLERIIFLNKTIVFLDSSKYKETKTMNNYAKIFSKMNRKFTVGKLIVVSDEYFGERGVNLIKNNEANYKLSNETIKCCNLVLEMIDNPTPNQIDERKMTLNNLNELVMYENHMTLIMHNHFLHTIDLDEKSLQLNQTVFSGLNKVKSLYIYKLDVKHLEPEIFSELGDLNVLHIYDNKLSSLDKSNIFKSLCNLKEIKLFNNRLVEIDAHIFNGLVNLTIIDLSRNQLKSVDEKLLIGLTNLKVINLSRNKLESIGDNLFKGLIGLTHIYLNNNQLKQLNHKIFDGLVNLQEISLYNNPFVKGNKDTTAGNRGSIKLLASY